MDGNIHVSDLFIHVTAPPGTATTGWIIFGLEVSSLLDGLRFMGQHPTDVSIDRVSIEGLPDNSPTSFGIVMGFGVGFNVVNEIIYTGELPRSSTPFDYYFLSGSLTVRNSSFKTALDGVSQDGFLQSSHITIGGSPSTGNTFENVFVGLDIEASESSVFEISHNVSSGIYAGMWVVPWQPAFVPASPSRYFVHDNEFTGTGQYAEGFYFLDDAANPWIQAAAWNNTVELQDTLSEGIGVYNTKGTAIWNNSVTGSGGFDAIGLWNSTFDAVANNNVSGFTPDPLWALPRFISTHLRPTTSLSARNAATLCSTKHQQSHHWLPAIRRLRGSRHANRSFRHSAKSPEKVATTAKVNSPSAANDKAARCLGGFSCTSRGRRERDN